MASHPAFSARASIPAQRIRHSKILKNDWRGCHSDRSAFLKSWAFLLVEVQTIHHFRLVAWLHSIQALQISTG
jgi:hypothetical protein